MYEQSDQEYFSIKQFDQIIEPTSQGVGGLFLGQVDLIQSKRLETLKIGAVISIIGFVVKIDQSLGVKHLFIQADDDEDTDLKQYFQMTYDFIHENIKKTNVFVHCQMGISRSSSIVIAYLMKDRGMNYLDTFNFVRSKRSCICPNDGFVSQLIEYQHELEKEKNQKNEH